jgi:hypothetical protein
LRKRDQRLLVVAHAVVDLAERDLVLGALGNQQGGLFEAVHRQAARLDGALLFVGLALW